MTTMTMMIRSMSTITAVTVSLLALFASCPFAAADNDSSMMKPRIIGGETAVKGEFSSVVWLGDRQEKLECGGTLISPNLVLTAAHCQE